MLRSKKTSEYHRYFCAWLTGISQSCTEGDVTSLLKRQGCNVHHVKMEKQPGKATAFFPSLAELAKAESHCSKIPESERLFQLQLYSWERRELAPWCEDAKGSTSPSGCGATMPAKQGMKVDLEKRHSKQPRRGHHTLEVQKSLKKELDEAQKEASNLAAKLLLTRQELCLAMEDVGCFTGPTCSPTTSIDSSPVAGPSSKLAHEDLHGTFWEKNGVGNEIEEIYLMKMDLPRTRIFDLQSIERLEGKCQGEEQKALKQLQVAEAANASLQKTNGELAERMKDMEQELLQTCGKQEQLQACPALLRFQASTKHVHPTSGVPEQSA